MTDRRESRAKDRQIDIETCTWERRLEITRSLPFLQDADTTHIQKLCGLFYQFGFESGQQIYSIGARATRVYVVASGSVRLIHPREEGRDVIVDLIGPGEHFGYFSAHEDDTYPESAIAHTSSCVLSIENADFQSTLTDLPSAAIALYRITAERLRIARTEIERLSADSPCSRVAARLIDLARRFGEHTDNGILIQIPFTREDLADMCGITQETASRCISAFRKDGIVATGRRWISVEDFDALLKHR